MNNIEFIIFAAISFYGTLKWSDRFFETSICSKGDFYTVCDNLKGLGLIEKSDSGDDEYLLTNKGRVHIERQRALSPPKIESRWVDFEGGVIDTDTPVDSDA